MENIERNAPATKGDIADSEERITQALRGIEAKLLNAFYGYAKTNGSGERGQRDLASKPSRNA